jgi:hypothetical protein
MIGCKLLKKLRILHGGRPHTPLAHVGREVPRTSLAVAWKRGMEDLCPRCSFPTWNGHYCAHCGYSAREWVPPYYKHASKSHYDMVVLDEAHYVKNAATLRGDAMLALRGARYKIALGGTPVMGFSAP